MAVLEIFVGCGEIFDECPGDIWWCLGDILFVSWRYLIGVLEISYGCPSDI